jgi:aspartate/methionine/tyrosine aminotransferase
MLMRPMVAERLASYQDSVFEQVTALARHHDAVNLGSGTPDGPAPDAMQSALREAIARGRNYYSPVRGEAVLRNAVATHSARFYGQQVDPANEVSITCGVTEALHAALLSLINPGDEVIVFEPFYDCYVPAIRLAGGRPVVVTLHAPSFRFDLQELRAAFSPRIKAIILNTPHNPTGTVFSRDELLCIAELCQEFDVLAITDEVYEHIVFDGKKHLRLATFPGMWERTLTISGAGKTFSCPGWRIGWAIGPEHFQNALCRLRQFTVFSAPTPLQHAVAAVLQLPDSYFCQLAAVYQARRDLLFHPLAKHGLLPNRPAGSFFILCDTSSFPVAAGREFCNYLTREIQVAPLPLDVFYHHQAYGERLARFTFCVRRELLETAANRLENLRPPSARCSGNGAGAAPC